jgi:ABC-type nitrate/sulfonate/bicarbonate transport system substrate-binding protein
MSSVRQILFVPPAPLVWAQHRGAFARHGVAVDTTQTVSSDQIGQGLADGTWDVGIGVVDNVIAWRAEFGADLVILAQLERSMVMAFVAQADRATLADVALQPVAVDSTSNGFVLVLYRALARAGIDWRGLRYDRVGGVRQRFEALLAGSASASILVPPFVDLALGRGLRKLWDGADIAPHYPGVVVTARRDWVAGHADAVGRYLAALVEANAWALGAPDEAVAALVEARYAEPAAHRLVRDAVPGLRVSRDGWDEVVGLRRECGLMPSPEPRAESVIDESHLPA